VTAAPQGGGGTNGNGSSLPTPKTGDPFTSLLDRVCETGTTQRRRDRSLTLCTKPFARLAPKEPGLQRKSPLRVSIRTQGHLRKQREKRRLLRMGAGRQRSDGAPARRQCPHEGVHCRASGRKKEKEKERKAGSNRTSSAFKRTGSAKAKRDGSLVLIRHSITPLSPEVLFPTPRPGPPSGCLRGNLKGAGHHDRPHSEGEAARHGTALLLRTWQDKHPSSTANRTLGFAELDGEPKGFPARRCCCQHSRLCVSFAIFLTRTHEK